VQPVSLAGTLDSMPLTDLLQWLDSGRKTGTLQVSGERYIKTLVTREGRVIGSASTDPSDHLGHFLLRLGHISEDDIKRAMEAQQATRVMLGKILVDSGVISEPDLQAALIQKAEETIFSLFLWENGRFEFRDGQVPDQIQVPLSLKISEVLLKGLTWYDELKKVRLAFASTSSVVARTAKTLPPAFRGATSLPGRILELVDGKHSIADICLEVHASEFAVGKLLHLLLQEGFIAVGKPAPVKKIVKPQVQVALLLDEARSLLRAGEAHAAVMSLEEARRAAPENSELGAALEEARAAFVHQACRDGLRPDAVPALLKPLESLVSEDLTPEEMFLLTRVNGTWDLRSILSVCPFPEPDALLHMKKLKDRGLIGIQVAV